MPGSNERAIAKGRALDCDGIIFDLEDAVAPRAKERARTAVIEAIAQGGYGDRELVVRVNGLDSQWGYGDLCAIARSGADAVLLPKVGSADMVRQCLAVLTQAGGPPKRPLWCMIETPLGVLNAAEIAGASPTLGALVMGTSDLGKDLRAQPTPQRLPMLTALGLCLLAGRAHGLTMLDGIHPDLNDLEGFAQSCRQGRELGFDGKTLIHPKTIALANQIFAPDLSEIAHCRALIATHMAALAEGKGVAVLDGRLVEHLHVQAAQDIVARADRIAARADRLPAEDIV